MLVFDGECRFQMDLQLGMSVSDGSPMKHVEVSDGSPIRYVGLQWGMSVTTGACRSLMGIRFSMSRYLMCLGSGMLVSDVACRGL